MSRWYTQEQNQILISIPKHWFRFSTEWIGILNCIYLSKLTESCSGWNIFDIKLFNLLNVRNALPMLLKNVKNRVNRRANRLKNQSTGYWLLKHCVISGDESWQYMIKIKIIGHRDLPARAQIRSDLNTEGTCPARFFFVWHGHPRSTVRLQCWATVATSPIFRSMQSSLLQSSEHWNQTDEFPSACAKQWR